MSKVYKALSALLSYPTQEVCTAADELQDIVNDDIQGPPWALRKINCLIDELRTLDIYELQERYVFLFDRTRSLSLHLFEHVHGESRDRGQAMVDLKMLYAEAGLETDARELPDFLPLFLEYLSLLPAEEAKTLLAEPVAVIAALKERLSKRQSVYAPIFALLETMAETAPQETDLKELRAAPDDDPNDLEALDKAWEDEPVTFGPGEEGCPKAEEMLKRMSISDEPASTATRGRS